MCYRRILSYILASILSGQVQHLTTSTPAQVCGLRDMVAVAAGGIGGLAVKGDGTVWEWYGKSAPEQVSGLSDIVRVAAGVCHSMALKNDGTVWEWEPGPWIAPVPAPSVRTRTLHQITAVTDVVAIAAGETRSLAVQRGGTVWEWTGRVAADYCGAWLPTKGPSKVSGPDVVAVSVAYEAWMDTLFDSRTLELRSDGTVWVWHAGEMGSSTVQIDGLDGIIAITAGPAGDVALKSDGTVWEWDDRLIPRQVSGLDGIVAVANGATGGNYAPTRGGDFGLALKDDGSVWAWGSGAPPAQLEGLSDVAVIAAAGVYAYNSGIMPVALAVKRDGTVWSWGETWNAHIGDGDNPRCAEPAEPAPLVYVPNPTVTGPVPVTAAPGDPSHNYPFFSTLVDLSKYGYVEEEFFIEGLANRYSIPAMGTATVIDGGHLYRTRIVVRRPVSPGRFNGTVVMEWQNTGNGFEIEPMWFEGHAHFIRRGHAWIGVSASQAGIHQAGTGLKAWSPTRYGGLDVSANGTITDDSLSYDIFSQAAQSVRRPVGIDVMSGLRVERVLATGVSMGAVRLRTYHNSIHPLAEVLDGFLLVHGGRQLRTDLGVKVFKLLSESEIAHQTADRQADSGKLRSWEVAGTSHMDYYFIEQLFPIREREGIVGTAPTCGLPPYSRIPERYAGNAALDHLVAWVRDYIEPPAAPPIETTSGTQVAVTRDGFGNALGGVRLPQHAVPTATNTGVNFGSCRVLGTYQPFDAATLQTLYPNRGAYVSAIVNATLDNLSKGHMVVEDAAETIREAAASGIPK